MIVIFTSPSLDPTHNISGIATVTNFIISKNPDQDHIHFEIGKRDNEGMGYGRVLSILKSYFKWVFVLMKTRDKMVHFNLPLDAKSVMRDCPLIILTRYLGVKMVIHLHGGAYILNDNIPSWAKVLLNRSFSGKNPKIVLGEVEKEFLINTFKCENVQVLSNSLNLDDAELFERATDEQLRFLFLGRLCKDKGLDYIYDAFKSLIEKHQYIPEFWMAGKGEDEQEYVEKFSELLGEKFKFKGVVFGEKKTELLKACNVFLLPSFYEGLPVAMLEAMSFGQAAIVTDVGSIKYVIEDYRNGLFVNKKNSEDIVTAILTLKNNPSLLTSISKNAKETVFTQFSPSDYISKLNLIYNYE